MQHFPSSSVLVKEHLTLKHVGFINEKNEEKQEMVEILALGTN